MRSITSKELHQQTGALLDKVKQGPRFRVLRGGEASALLVPVTEQVAPPSGQNHGRGAKDSRKRKAAPPSSHLGQKKKAQLCRSRTPIFPFLGLNERPLPSVSTPIPIYNLAFRSNVVSARDSFAAVRAL